MDSTIRVLIVDDSAVYREFLAHLLASDTRILIAGTASDGESALAAVTTLRPDVITMDINMQGMNGYEVTRRIMESTPTPIIIVSGIDGAGDVRMSFRAMESGAVAVVMKPQGGTSPDSTAQSEELILMVKLMAEVKVVRRWSLGGGTPKPDKPARSPSRPVPVGPSSGCDAVLIGASAGGPVPLNTILAALPQGFSAPVLVVQHIAAGFVEGFAQWLSSSCRLPIHIAADGELVLPGHVYIAPDQVNMGVGHGRRIRLSRGPAENGLRPSVSHLFRSAAAEYGSRAVGILLSGMGRDGAEELKALRDLGAPTFAQDSESCVVFGMPGEAVRLGAASYVMPPEEIAAAVLTIAGTAYPGQGRAS